MMDKFGKSWEAAPFLVGENIYLRPMIEADAEGAYVFWFNDPEVCQGNSHHVFPYTIEAAIDYIHHANKTKDHLILAIISGNNDKHIGNIALQHIHPVYHSAEFSIVIGEKEVWGQGVGKEAGHLIFDHGFMEMNLHRIACGTFANNLAMQQLARSLGMVEEGVRRQAAYKDGKYLDVIEFGILKEEFINQRN